MHRYTDRVNGGLLLLTSIELHLTTGADVDEGELEERAEHEHHAHRVPDIDRLRIGDLHLVTCRRGQLRRHRQYGGDAESDACRLRSLVDPEANPGEHHDQHRWNERLQDEEADLALKQEHCRQTREFTCHKACNTENYSDHPAVHG